jgi:hypothetical protein
MGDVDPIEEAILEAEAAAVQQMTLHDWLLKPSTFTKLGIIP